MRISCAHDYSETMKSARKMLDTQEDFMKDIQQINSFKRASDSSVNNFSELERMVQGMKGTAENVKGDWMKKRSKASKHTQNFTTKFSGFLESYSGIVEVVKGADQQYGGLAYGLLMRVCKVAVNKSRHEAVIEETMDNVRSSLPRMRAFKEIYPTKELEDLVAKVYIEVMQFLRQSIKYYLRPGYRTDLKYVGCQACAHQILVRLWHAVSHPPKMGLEVDVAKIACKINEVIEESTIGLHQRVRDVQNQFSANEKSVASRFDQVNTRLDQVDARFGPVNKKILGEHIIACGRSAIDWILCIELEQHRIEENQIELRNHLMPGWTDQVHDSELASYQSLLEHEFGVDCIERTLSDLCGREEYAQWRNNKQSCILRLSGYTSNCTGLCWLSAIIPSLIKQLRGQKHHLIFCLIQQQHWMEEEVPMEKILTNITFQLLQRWSENVHDWKLFSEVHQELKKHTWAEDLVSLRRVLVTVLAQLEETTIILDRIDRAKQAPKVIKTLLQILSESHCVARILLVTKPASTAMEWELDTSDEVKQKVTYLEIDGWDQEQDEPKSTSRRRLH
ncbi:MAG: hypothetical protein Q9226_006353 [Calogaya cf. arnoldii]